MIFYAIRDKRNGGYLPQMPHGRGMTHREAIAPSILPVIPRLFKSRHAANCALHAWVEGAWTVVNTVDPESGYEDNGIDIKPCGRRKENMEIVEVPIPEMGNVT